MDKKYIVVTGGELSGVGKGILSASTARVLEECDLKINTLKIDPYLNIDAGTMNPNQHGEVFVTEDGYEADLDLGHYERFLGKEMKRINNLTAGQIYKTIIEKERLGEYLGATVQVVPHVTNEIKDKIKQISGEVVMIEIGGTVGDIEAEIFLEAIRELALEQGPENFLFVHVTYVPYLEASREFKTKPTQQSIQLLRRIGIQPNVIVVRSKSALDNEQLDKISLFGGVKRKNIFSLPDVSNVYEIPSILYSQNIHRIIASELNLKLKHKFNWSYPVVFEPLKIAIVGKYTETEDAYKSISESILLCGVEKPEIIDVHEFDEIDDNELESKLTDYYGIIIPGGFGERGIESKIRTTKYARINHIPILGICLGMQLMIVEFARNVHGMKDANSTEFNPDTPYPVIDLMEEQKRIMNLGGTMRLGNQKMRVTPSSKLASFYGKKEIVERHRHRYEVNYEAFKFMYTKSPSDKSNTKLFISAESKFVEAIELNDHPFFVGVQYHPEFKSKVGNPHPLFTGFVNSIRNGVDRHGTTYKR
ncbi:MAG: CTP synthase [Kosmotoga sp.]|nr:MAG: CTP synthase [Kosmotoga sp.]